MPHISGFVSIFPYDPKLDSAMAHEHLVIAYALTVCPFVLPVLRRKEVVFIAAAEALSDGCGSVGLGGPVSVIQETSCSEPCARGSVKMKSGFSLGNRVRVSDGFFWAKG
jgi:hypothetical protein